MLRKTGVWVIGIMLLAVVWLVLFRPKPATNAPLILLKQNSAVQTPQTVIANTELAALNINGTIST